MSTSFFYTYPDISFKWIDSRGKCSYSFVFLLFAGEKKEMMDDDEMITFSIWKVLKSKERYFLLTLSASKLVGY